MIGKRDAFTLRPGAEWLLGAVLSLVLLLASGCGGAAYSESASPGGPAKSMSAEPQVEMTAMDEADYGGDGDYDDAPMEPPDASYGRATAQAGSASGQPAPQAPPTTAPPPPSSRSDGHKQVAGPLLIYRADVHMAVFEAEKTLDAAESMAKTLGGYLVRRSDTEIVIRVPAKKFERAMKSIGGMGDVLHRNIEVKDVTEQFYDLQVRLRNARAVRDRFQQLLLEAKTVKDSLAIEKELERITDKIERFEGKLKVLRELIAFSTITLRLQAEPHDQVDGVDLPFPWLRELGLPGLLRM